MGTEMLGPSGVIAAAPTPINQNMTPDTAAYIDLCQWLLDNGCDGINMLGTTGEANSFALIQRMHLIEAVAKSNLPKSRLLVGTGGCVLADTIQLSNVVVDAGFAGILVLPPFYYKPVTDDGLFAFFANLADSIESAAAKIYLYNFPQLTGISLSLDLVSRLAQAFPGRFVGIKDSSGDIDFSRRIVKALTDFRVFPSTEAILSEARAEGFAGCISATVNVTCQLAGRVWRAPSGTDDGSQMLLTKLRQVIATYPLVPAVKFLVARRSRNEGWRRVLPPLTPLTAEQGKALLADWESANGM